MMTCFNQTGLRKNQRGSVQIALRFRPGNFGVKVRACVDNRCENQKGPAGKLSLFQFLSHTLKESGVPKGIRTPVAAVKGRFLPQFHTLSDASA